MCARETAVLANQLSCRGIPNAGNAVSRRFNRRREDGVNQTLVAYRDLQQSHRHDELNKTIALLRKE
jgi:hypothetical protein